MNFFARLLTASLTVVFVAVCGALGMKPHENIVKAQDKWTSKIINF